ncbi:phosphatidylinositol N-acetylglucosaminyltransferase subunit P-like isoform X1 [Salvia hispanica]|uniref:phosphatidylinositol N-acetylglucosaminyltransferase subunit P-like isoform X1 n=1 Tax=Salvia hispanica TaxID=49212 RepID=UPI0020099D16|nr:phosphatidylinositol N-acetylglucosaminyltransferase subunit P-like isoform X1 [Salvia hispanica]XP_047981701.1 phosphatidylinositol N-acetylglucosaminyltransferase subunit P-like isoform X1 [Salvia hispanica]XP_047981702.1 phosphatidylinositol N-acetylglucosaminyltransferase subunit P-like isoform X1 [Salvia hispanica]
MALKISQMRCITAMTNTATEIRMEERCSVNSPRQILSFSKTRVANVSFSDADHRSQTELGELGVSGEHGPKLSEVYGFVGSITTVVFTVIFIVWAYVPDHWLHSIGIYYYPSRYWALAVPTYVMVTIVLAVTFYIGMNFMLTPPPTSLNIMFDEFSREMLSSVPLVDDDEQPIEPISDIGINKINKIMFESFK